MNKLVDLLIIDPQKDFVEKYGSLISNSQEMTEKIEYKILHAIFSRA